MKRLSVFIYTLVCILLSININYSISVRNEELNNRKKNSIFKSHSSAAIEKGGSQTKASPKPKGGKAAKKAGPPKAKGGETAKKAEKKKGGTAPKKGGTASKKGGTAPKKGGATKTKKSGSATKRGTKAKKSGSATKRGTKAKKGGSKGGSKGGTKVVSSGKNIGESFRSGIDIHKIITAHEESPGVTNDDHSFKMKKLEHPNFDFPASITEQYRANEYTSSGGIFSDSQALKTCHRNKLETGKCTPPCFDVVPGDETGRCFVYSKDRECLCVDPCSLFSSKELDPISGSTVEGSGDGCEHCVRHKSWRFFVKTNGKAPSRINPRAKPSWVNKFQFQRDGPSGMDLFAISCGMCDTECVAGTLDGPAQDGEECPGVWNWKIDQCRRMELTSEEMASQEQGEFETYHEVKEDENKDDKKGATGAADKAKTR